MTPEQVLGFYAAATGCDSRLKPLVPMAAKVWAQALKDVPFRETEHILTHIYAAPQMVMLQPGHVVEAWEEVKADRRRIIERVQSIDRYLAATGETDPGVLEEKLTARAGYIAQLPEHVVEYAGIRQQQLNPPPKYPKAGGELVEVDFTAGLKRPA